MPKLARSDPIAFLEACTPGAGNTGILENAAQIERGYVGLQRPSLAQRKCRDGCRLGTRLSDCNGERKERNEEP